jgi:hypothetical protein
MNLKEKLVSIDKDIDSGLKFKSADRLRNLINQYPTELIIWKRLAELYYESGFYDAAGRYWVLTKPTEERIKKCINIYLNSVNNSGTQVLLDITFRGDKDKLPEYAKNKLTEFETDSKLKSKYVPTFKAKQNKQQRQSAKYEKSFMNKLGGWVILGLLLLTVFCAIVGFITAIGWIF